MVGCYIPLQQHLSTSFFASLHNNFPFFSCWQQQIFTSLPVSVHVIFGDAANTTAAITVITAKGQPLGHCLHEFHLLSAYFLFHQQDSPPRSNKSFGTF